MPITLFMMKMVTSVLRPITKRDVVFLINLKDANFQIPIRRGLESLWLHTWKLSNISPKSQAFVSRLQMLHQQTFGSPKSFLHQGKWSRFLRCCCGRNIASCKTTFQELPAFFLYIQKDLKLFVLAIKGCRSALNDVFILYVIDIAVSAVINHMFSGFKRSFPPREIKPPDWKLSLVLRNFNCLPY